MILTPDFGLIFWTTLIVLIVFFLLRKMAWKPILSALDQREKNIADALATAEKAKQEMASLKAENEKIIADAKAERNQIIKEARDMKDQIVNEARDKAKQEAATILADSKREIENQKMAAIIELKNNVGNMVISVSKEILQRELADQKAQESHISSLLEKSKLN